MNTLTEELLEQLFSQESGDPFLTLITLEHPDFPAPIRLVNNTVDIVSRGNTYSAFPARINLPVDDGESNRQFSLELDNVGLELIDEIRTVVGDTQIQVRLESILASIPDEVQMSFEELKILSVTYNRFLIQATLGFDDFLNTELSSERYTPTNFRGLF